MNTTEESQPSNALFIICPFCHLEHFLRANFGEKIFFYTVPGGVLNFHSYEALIKSGFLKREKITDIYLVNDVSCSFIEDTINEKNEFGLNCEKKMRELFKKLSDDIEYLNLKEKKDLLAKSNVSKQIDYLNSNNIFKDDTSPINIKMHGMITDKNHGFEILN